MIHMFLDWILENLGTLVVALVLAAVVALAIFVLVRDKRKGRHLGCSCVSVSDCAQCSLMSTCEQASQNEETVHELPCEQASQNEETVQEPPCEC